MAVTIGVKVVVTEAERVDVEESDGDKLLDNDGNSVLVELIDDVADDDAVTEAVGVRVGVKQGA